MFRYNKRFVELVRKGQEQGKLMEASLGSSSNAIWDVQLAFTGGMTTDPVSSSQAGSDPEHVKQIFLRLICTACAIPDCSSSRGCTLGRWS